MSGTESQSVPGAEFFNAADRARRAQARALDALGFGPRPLAARTVQRAEQFDVLAYQLPGPRRSCVLVIPAPIKRHYIWDLAPGASAVAPLVAAGHAVYLIVWKPPSHGALGLADYAERILGIALDVLRRETGSWQAFLAGHSLGGTFAAIFASLHPERVRGLIALEAPIEFSRGALEAMARAAPLAAAPVQASGLVPGSFLNFAATCAAPITFAAEPLLDRMLSAASGTTALHLRVRRWALDELPMPSRLFDEVTRALYRENRFALGRLELAGERADPRAIRAPILVASDPRSRIVPRADLIAYRTRTTSSDVEFTDYFGDVGVMLQHVGLLVGANAHRQLWPRILQWLRRHGMDSATRTA